jgi:hypothetical protein
MYSKLPFCSLTHVAVSGEHENHQQLFLGRPFKIKSEMHRSYEWTKAALLKSQQGLLPLPVFKLQPALIAPVAIFLLVGVLSVRSANQGKGRTVLVISLALLTIIATSGLVSAACLFPWFPRHP